MRGYARDSDKTGGISGELAQERFESAADALQRSPRFEAATALFALCETPAGAGHRVSLLVEEFLDLEDQDHIPLAVQALSPAALARLQGGKLALPIAENVRRNPRDGGDVADTEVEAIRNLGLDIGGGLKRTLPGRRQIGRKIVAPRGSGHDGT
jgi:hypothetical protein